MARLAVGNGSAQERKTEVPEIADERQQAQRGREALARRDSVRTAPLIATSVLSHHLRAFHATGLADSTAVLKG